MMKTQTDCRIERYLKQAHQVLLELASGEALEKDLLELIDRLERETEDQPAYQAFFRAERAFHERNYKEALSGYLQLTDIPLHHFFCYRASAFLLASLGQSERALDFAKRALAIQRSDLETLRLCKELGLAPSEVPQAAMKDDSIHQQATVSLAAAEFDALAGIFQEDEAEKVDVVQRAEEVHMTRVEVVQPVRTFLSEDAGVALEERIHILRQSQKQQLLDYLERAQQAAPSSDWMYVLNGWSEREEEAWCIEDTKCSEGGYFLRWNGLGIAINPGRYFLRLFHEQGLYLRDIDCVIVTSGQPENYADVRAIHEFNSRLNRSQHELHVIRYYLHRQAYQELATDLKPNFKQEAGSVHSLELYIDSPESESIALHDAVDLHYFQTSTKESSNCAIGIRLELRPNPDDSSQTRSVHIGYASGTPWSPVLASYLNGCDLLIVGIENSSPDDYQKQSYNKDSLGYYGASSLALEAVPRLLVCSEFGGHEGDIRLELIQKMRREVSSETVILPGDAGLHIDLQTLTVRCTVTGAAVDPACLRVAKSRQAFGHLQYLSPDCIL